MLIRTLSHCVYKACSPTLQPGQHSMAQVPELPMSTANPMSGISRPKSFNSSYYILPCSPFPAASPLFPAWSSLPPVDSGPGPVPLPSTRSASADSGSPLLLQINHNGYLTWRFISVLYPIYLPLIHYFVQPWLCSRGSGVASPKKWGSEQFFTALKSYNTHTWDPFI